MDSASARRTRTVASPTGPTDAPEVRWRFTDATKLTVPVAATADTVFIASTDTDLYAVDAETGTEQWRFEEATGIAVLPMVVGDTLYFGTGVNDTSVFALT